MIFDGIIEPRSTIMRTNKFGNSIIISLFTVVLLASCNIRSKLADEEQAKIADFLAKNPNLAFQQKQSGLYYLDIVVGTGPEAEANDTALVFYNMKFLDGQVFETNVGTTDTLRVLVNGWKLAVRGFDEAITYMREGGQSFLLVPSKLAFGEVGISTIGGYTPLLFDCYLVKLKKHTAK